MITKLKTAEVFCGTKSASKVFAEHGHKTYTIDNDAQFEPDLRISVLNMFDDHFGRIAEKPDLLWASPPCTAFSVASMGHHWGGGDRGYIPKTPTAKLGVRLAKKTIKLIETSKPRWWFIENPRGVLRNLPFMDEFLKRQGGGSSYGLVLQIRRRPREAHRHLDERDMVEAAQRMPQQASRSSAGLHVHESPSRTSRRQDRDAGHRRSERSRPHTASALRGNTRADA